MTSKDIFNQFITTPSLIYTYFGMAAVVFTTTSMITWLSSYFEVTRHIAPGKAGTLSSSIMGLAIIGAPLGGYLTDKWRETNAKARLLFPAVTTLLSAIFLFAALRFTGTVQYILFLCFGIMITMFISAAAAVTQDVIHAGLRAVSYSIAVVIQNLLGASMAPIIIGSLYDKYDIETAFFSLPFILAVGAILFFLGSKHYERDLAKVPQVEILPESVQ